MPFRHLVVWSAALCSLAGCAASVPQSVLVEELDTLGGQRVSMVLMSDGRRVHFNERGAIPHGGTAGVERLLGVTRTGTARSIPVDSAVEATLAEGTTAYRPGQRAVAIGRNGSVVGGFLAGVRGDSLLLVRRGDTIGRARSDLDRIELPMRPRGSATLSMGVLGGYAGMLFVFPLIHGTQSNNDFPGGTYHEERAGVGFILSLAGAAGFGVLGAAVDEGSQQQREVIPVGGDGREMRERWERLAASDDFAKLPPLSISFHGGSVSQSANDALDAQLGRAGLRGRTFYTSRRMLEWMWLRRIDIGYSIIDRLDIGASWADISELATGGYANDSAGYAYDRYVGEQVTGRAFFGFASYRPLPPSRFEIALTGGLGYSSATLQRKGTLSSSITQSGLAGLVAARVAVAATQSMRLGLSIDHIFAGSIEDPGSEILEMSPTAVPIGNTCLGFVIEQRF